MPNWSAWNDGTHLQSGDGYGIAIPLEDRDRYFQRGWHSIEIEFPGLKLVTVEVDEPSLWADTTPVLVGKGIGVWLIKNGLAPWSKKSGPPRIGVQMQEGYLTVLSIVR